MLVAAAFVVASGTVVQAQTRRFMPHRAIDETMRERVRERREAAAERAAQSRAMAEARAEARRTRMLDRRDMPSFGDGLRRERAEIMRIRRLFEADRRGLMPRQHIPRTPRPPALERRIHRLSMGD
jgi:hypothetical protein